jgi:hypothetical protein
MPDSRSQAVILAKPHAVQRVDKRARDLVDMTQKPKAKARKNIFARGFSRLWRIFLMTIGGLLVLMGILIAPLPGPMGLPLSILGLILLLRNSYWAKRQFVKYKKRYPNWIMPLRKLLRPKPKVASVFWQQALKTERLVFKPDGRILLALRRKFSRRSKSDT